MKPDLETIQKIIAQIKQHTEEMQKYQASTEAGIQGVRYCESEIAKLYTQLMKDSGGAVGIVGD